MKLLCVAGFFASAAAFQATPAAFSTQNSPVIDSLLNPAATDGASHHTRRATILMDGKANG